ncbi:hypothetical protein GC163_00105 [bacterium]|nr:hypothetical protein [bacterium]
MIKTDQGLTEREFKPGIANLVAGVIIGLLLITAGLAGIYFPARQALLAGGNLPFWVKKGWCWFAILMFWGLGTGAIMGGGWLILAMRTLLSFRVKYTETGLELVEGTNSRSIPWHNVTSVVETHLYERPPVLKGPAKLLLPKLMSKSYKLEVSDGEPFEFDGNSVQGHTTLAVLIQQKTRPLNVPWDIVEEHVG